MRSTRVWRGAPGQVWRGAPGQAWRGALGSALCVGFVVGSGLAGHAAQPRAVDAAQSSRAASLLCDGLGEVVVQISGSPFADGSVTVVDGADGGDGGEVRISGRPGFDAVDSRGGQRVVVPPTGDGVACTGLSLTGLTWAQAAPAGMAPPAGVGARHRLNGTLTWRVTVVAPPAVTPGFGRTEARPAVVPFPYEAEIRSYLATRPGAATVAVLSAGSPAVMTYTKSLASNVTASIVKVDIMATVLKRAQDAGRSLTSWERSQLVPMIRLSDNAATTALWNYVGGGPAVARVNALMGLRSTAMGPGGYWGLTTTTAPDQVILVGHFATPNVVLSDSSRAYGLALMRTVTSSQAWGVSAGPPAHTVALKNGWLPRTDGWHVNSIGFGAPSAHRYVVAVLTSSPGSSQATQIATIEGVSRIVWRHQSVRGDWTGEGATDLLATKADGSLWLYPGVGSGGVRSGAQIGNGWASMTWLGSPGDVTGDGHTDLVARSTDGNLWLYLGRGAGGFISGRKIGNGWDTLTALATPGDIDGDGYPDLLGRRADGTLHQYRLLTTGSVGYVRQVGNGWNGLSWIVGTRDFTGDHLGDLVAVRADGLLFGYRSTGTGLSGIGQLGNGWSVMTWLTSPGDMNSDGWADLVARSADGNLWLYPGRFGGGFSGKVQIGNGWTPFTRIL